MALKWCLHAVTYMHTWCRHVYIHAVSGVYMPLHRPILTYSLLFDIMLAKTQAGLSVYHYLLLQSILYMVSYKCM